MNIHLPSNGSIFDQIRNSTDVSEVLDFHGVAYKQQRNGAGRACCPLCDSDNPTAFSFLEDSYHCFRCDAKGDVIDLEMALTGKNVKQAAEALAIRKGIAVVWGNGDRRSTGQPRHISTYLPPKTPLSRLIRREWDERIGSVKLLRDVKVSALAAVERQMRDNPTADLCSLETARLDLESQIDALDAELIKMNYEANQAAAATRKRERNEQRQRLAQPAQLPDDQAEPQDNSDHAACGNEVRQ